MLEEFNIECLPVDHQECSVQKVAQLLIKLVGSEEMSEI